MYKNRVRNNRMFLRREKKWNIIIKVEHIPVIQFHEPLMSAISSVVNEGSRDSFRPSFLLFSAIVVFTTSG